jgi:electron transfer flavoprotein alpha subunit
MDTILLVSHVDPDGALPKAALEALGAAKALGAPVVAALFGPSVEKAAAALAGTGVAKVLAAEDPALAEPRYATDAAAAAALAKAAGASIVVAPATSRMARVMPGVAQRLGGRVDTHVTQVSSEGGPAVVRWYYRQRIEAKVRRKERPWVLLVDPGATAAVQREGAAAPAIERSPSRSPPRAPG